MSEYLSTPLWLTYVALLLGSSLAIEDRRRHEHELLKLYQATLSEHGVTNYPFAQCWDDYRPEMFKSIAAHRQIAW